MARDTALSCNQLVKDCNAEIILVYTIFDRRHKETYYDHLSPKFYQQYYAHAAMQSKASRCNTYIGARRVITQLRTRYPENRFSLDITTIIRRKLSRQYVIASDMSDHNFRAALERLKNL